MRGGQPSTTTPIAGPCDSPNVVTRKSTPKLEPTGEVYDARHDAEDFAARSVRRLFVAVAGARNAAAGSGADAATDDRSGLAAGRRSAAAVDAATRRAGQEGRWGSMPRG